MNTTTTHITHIGTAIVNVQDADAALAYYTEKLGFEKRLDVPFGENDRWIEVAPAGAQTSIALAPPPPDGTPVGTTRNIGFATKDIDAARAELEERGADVDAEVTRLPDPVPPMFWVRDPEGNVLMVVERDD
jgi:predicted enzyme related to lactoylglutathione lyase